MRSGWLWIRVHGLRQFLLVAAGCGIASALGGEVLAPVPGQLFSSVAGVPLAYLPPVVLGVSIAQTTATRLAWYEPRTRRVLFVVTVAAGLALACVPLLIGSGAITLTLVSARNAVLVTALSVCLRRYLTAAAATAGVVAPHLVLWTFGWADDGEPRAWALTLLPAYAVLPALLAGGLAAVGLRRPR